MFAQVIFPVLSSLVVLFNSWIEVRAGKHAVAISSYNLEIQNMREPEVEILPNRIGFMMDSEEEEEEEDDD